MKKLFALLFASTLLISCEGDPGPPGLPGPQGPQGPYIVGTVFEIANVDFTPNNDYSFYGFFYDYIPADIEIYASDVVLIYLHEGVANGNDVWSLLPQTFYLQDGILEYNYNHTVEDFFIYLHGTHDLNFLPSGYTQNQIFRVAILPADFAISGKVDISNYNSVVSELKTANPEFEVITIEK